MFCLTLGVNLPVRAQAPGSGVGATYLASIYGVKCDGSTDDTTALLALVHLVHTSSMNGGGTIVLPSTGNWCKILGSLDDGGNGWPAEVNLVGCGMYGSQSSSAPARPACGLDLELNDTTAKIRLITQGQTIFRDLAIVDENSTGDCTDAVLGSPFFLITETVVHFQNVSISGAKSKLNACNDAFILGNRTVVMCGGSGLSACFEGYGSTFQNIYTANARRIALFNTAANGTDWDYVLADSTNGNKISGVLGSAFEFNSPNTVGNGGEPYGNVFKNLAIEQGDTAQQNYQYALDIIQHAGPNSVFGISCSDVPMGVNQPCVHIGSTDVYPQMVLGCSTNSTPLFPGCVAMDGIGSYPDIVADLYNSNPAFYSRNYYGGNLGTSSHPFSYLRLSGGIDSPSKMTGIPNVDKFGGIVGFSNTTPNPFAAQVYPLFSDSPMSTVGFTVFPIEAWLGQFTFYTSTSNGASPIQLQPIYSVGGAVQPSPIVFSIPAGASSGYNLTNAPPFYVSAEDQIDFQGVNGSPSGATVNGFTANIMGSTDTVLGTYYNGTVAAPSGTTYFTSFSQKAGWANTGAANEKLAYTVVPFTYIAHDLCVYTNSPQPSSGDLEITLRQNGGSVAPMVTIPINGAAGAWCDAHSFTSSTTGDQLDLMLVNHASALSANIVSITLGMTPTSPATGMLIFGLGAIGAISTGSTDHYFAPFGGSSSVTTTLANAQVAVPRAINVKNLHCWVVACPSTSATFKVFQNGVFPTGGLTKTIPSVCMPNTDYSDTTNMMSFMPGDTIELNENQSSSPTGPTVASCTVEHD